MSPPNPRATLSAMPTEVLLLILEAVAPVAPLYLRDERQNIPKGTKTKAKLRARTKEAQMDMFSLLTGLGATSRYMREIAVQIFWKRAGFILEPPLDENHRCTGVQLCRCVTDQWAVLPAVQTSWTTIRLTKPLVPQVVWSHIQQIELNALDWEHAIRWANGWGFSAFSGVKHLTISTEGVQNFCIAPLPWNIPIMFDSGVLLLLRPMDKVMKEWWRFLGRTSLKSVSIRRKPSKDSRVSSRLRELAWILQPSLEDDPLALHTIKAPLEWTLRCGLREDDTGGLTIIGDTKTNQVNSVLETLDKLFLRNVHVLLDYLAKHPREATENASTDEAAYDETWQNLADQASRLEVYTEGLRDMFLV